MSSAPDAPTGRRWPRAKRSLSQNFLVDHNLRRKLIRELAPEAGDSVLEIGPGHGELSELLMGRVRCLTLIEKDDQLAAELAERWRDRQDLRVRHGDALECDLSVPFAEEASVRVISNVPYAITSPLIFRLLDLRPSPVRCVLTVQREVAERIAAAVGTRAYGALSVGVRSRARVRVAFVLGRKAFRPVPRVESAAIVLEPRDFVPPPALQGALRRLTRVAFGRRRKQLQTILRHAPEYGLSADRVAGLCARIGVNPRDRPERLTPEVFLLLARALEEETREAPASG